VVDAVSAALTLQAASSRPTLVLVFSDGVDTASWLTPGLALDQARRSDVVIDGVVVGPGFATDAERVVRGEPVGETDDHGRFLLHATRATGGHLFDGSRGERLAGAFVEALGSFRQRYEITYTVTGAMRAGWHPIDVQVLGRRNLTIRARPGYVR
jgi:hypothetical protein